MLSKTTFYCWRDTADFYDWLSNPERRVREADSLLAALGPHLQREDAATADDRVLQQLEVLFLEATPGVTTCPGPSTRSLRPRDARFREAQDRRRCPHHRTPSC